MADLVARLSLVLVALALAGGERSAQRPCPLSHVRPLSLGAGDAYGAGMATDGTLLAVGSSFGGVITVFERDGLNWFVVDEVDYVGTGAGALFGDRVDIAGALLVSSTPGEPPTARGRVQIYERQGQPWVHVATVAASDEGNSANFGADVATDGVRVVAGAVGVPVVGLSAAWRGAAYVFEDLGSGWVETQRITPDDAANGDWFGSAIVMQDDLLFVAAVQDNGPTFIDTGSVYVFQRGASGYTQLQKLEGSGLVQSAKFGESIAVDGTTLFVGAPDQTFVTNQGEGAVYVYEQQGSAWTEVQILQASDAFFRERFGTEAAVSNGTALVSATERTEAEGAIYAFEEGPGGWVETALLERSGGKSGDRFGSSLAILDGVAVGGAPLTAAGGAAASISLDGSDCRTLSAFPAEHSLSQGGFQVQELDPGASFAGATYWVIGTAGATSPGFTLQGRRIPVNPDPWFKLTTLINNPFWTRHVGVLDALGQATAWVNFPPTTDTSLIGLELKHTFGVFSGNLVHVGNTTSLRLKP